MRGAMITTLILTTLIAITSGPVALVLDILLYCDSTNMFVVARILNNILPGVIQNVLL